MVTERLAWCGLVIGSAVAMAVIVIASHFVSVGRACATTYCVAAALMLASLLRVQRIDDRAYWARINGKYR